MSSPAGAAEEPELTPSRFVWRHLDRDDAARLWEELIDWTAWLRGRYELADAVPPCWFAHPPVVEELTALMVAWTAAYYGGDHYRDDLTAWHTQWLRPALARLRQVSDFEACTHEQCSHRPPAVRTLHTLAEVVAADVDARPAPPAPPAAPASSPPDPAESMSSQDMTSAVVAGMATWDDAAGTGAAVRYLGHRWELDPRTHRYHPDT